MEGLKSIVPTLSANDCLIRNVVIRRYVRSIDLEYRQLFMEEVGTIKFGIRMLSNFYFCKFWKLPLLSSTPQIYSSSWNFDSIILTTR